MIIYFSLTYVYKDDDYYDIPILLCAGEGGYSSDRQIIVSHRKDSSNNLYKNNLYSNNLYIYNISIITLCYTYE